MPFITFSDCASGWTFFAQTGKCYKYITSEVSWTEARTTCQTTVPANGDLASVPDSATNDFLANLTESTKFTWVGGHQDQSSTWVWSDGTPWEYVSWYSTQPGNERGNEDYLVIKQSGTWWDGQVNGLPGNVPGFICQYQRFQGSYIFNVYIFYVWLLFLGGFPVIKDIVLDTIDIWGPEYVVSFEVYINSFGIEQFTDIFTFHSYGKPGKVNPTILLHSKYLQFGAQTNNGNNFKIFYFVPNNENENVTINEKTWIKLDIRQYTQNYGKVK